jgi:uncharacterized protein
VNAPLGVVGLGDVGRSLREGLFMLWETTWPLILGFSLSGTVQAFVSQRSVRRRLGDHRPAAIARASAYGMASSSCSYAAAAMAKSLFTKGADFVSAMVFMVASTNLVVELGAVLLVLLGWQFAAGEFVGGAIMILLLGVVGSVFLGGRRVAEARERLAAGTGRSVATSPDDGSQASQPRPPHLLNRGGWADAATYTVTDLTMVRKELVIGYGVAGFLAVLVPARLWNAVFLHGHGIWTTLENVAVGPLVAVASFVCSVGNIPLAAALWQGGISFGGVVSFIFADLITLPLLLIYRRYYGTRLMLRMVAVFWSVMALAGLITEGIFRAADLVPTTRAARGAVLHFQWDYTTWLDIAALALLALLYWVYRHRGEWGGGGVATLDPVCGMQVKRVSAPASTDHAGRTWYFCSDRCLNRFLDRPHHWMPERPVATAVGGSSGRASLGDHST